MKKPHSMRMDELLSLPIITAAGAFDRVDAFGGCFRDRKGVLWGTCLLDKAWARYPAVRLAQRTGLSEERLEQASTLRGYIDICDGTRVTGWAQDEATPDVPITLDVVINGKLVARTTADQFRGDLLHEGIGTGRHAFAVSLPNALPVKAAHFVVVQRTDDGMLLDLALVAPEPAAA